MASMSNVIDLFSVKGMVAVVTGGGTGIGLMIAKALENNGAIVYVASRRLDVLEQAAHEHSKHGNLIPVACDVASLSSIQTLVDTVKRRHGYLNLLVNNAGVSLNMLPKIPRPPEADITELQQAMLVGTPDDFATSFNVNTTAAYYCSVLFLELLDAGNKRGNAPPGVTSQIITIASGGGFRKDDSVFSVSYTLSKTAAIQLGKLLAGFLKDWHIRSNVICPGIFPSSMTDGLLSEETVKTAVPLQRAGTEDDVAGIILFLTSKAGAYVNGAVHLQDGGRLLLFPSTY